MDRQPAVYIMSNRAFGTLYIGVTSNLIKRVWEHREEKVAGFTREYALHRLVWFELHATMLGAIAREKQLKKWKRAWKIELIHTMNPEWRDLWDRINGNGSPHLRG